MNEEIFNPENIEQGSLIDAEGKVIPIEEKKEKLFGISKEDIDELYSGNDNSEMYRR